MSDKQILEPTESAVSRALGFRTPLQYVDIEEAKADPNWDDAIHVAAPWERRSSLCGNWNRNLVDLDDELPGALAGCWTCLLAATWLAKALTQAALPLPSSASDVASPNHAVTTDEETTR